MGLQAAPSGGDAISDTTTPVIQSSDVMEPFDYLLHRFETDPRGRSGGIGLHILDQAPDFERVQEACDRASRSAIRMRQKVVVPPFGLGTPEWVVDPDFDLNFHVRRVRAPAPGTFAQVLDMTRQMRPAFESILAGHNELGVGQSQIFRTRNDGVNPLCRRRAAGAIIFQ